MISIVSRMFTLLSFVLLCVSGCKAPTPLPFDVNTLEAIYGVHHSDGDIHFIVKSTGCTNSQSFQVFTFESEGVTKVALLRETPDRCKAKAKLQRVSYPLPKGITQPIEQIQNPIWSKKGFKH